MSTRSSPETFLTIKAAKQAGFHERKEWEYGGEEILVKNHRLVRNPEEAISETAWSKRGYRLKADAEPHCTRSVRSHSASTQLIYPVYRDDQVEPKRQQNLMPAAIINILPALWVINRRAKRCREMAKSHYRHGSHGFAATCKDEKEEMYRLKGQALHYLLEEQRLILVGHHRFPGGIWAELLQGEGFTFHRPCQPQEGAAAEDRSEIEAKPRGTKEPRLKDAIHTVTAYLADKPEVTTFEWPSKQQSSPDLLEEGETELDDDGDDYYDDEFEYPAGAK